MRLLPLSFNVLQEILQPLLVSEMEATENFTFFFFFNKHLSAGTVLPVAKLGCFIKVFF